MKQAWLASIAVIVLAPFATAQTTIDHYSAGDLEQKSATLKAEASQKPEGVVSQNLQSYGNHLTLLAFRNKSGSAELHEHYADVFFVVDGRAVLVTGGKIVNPKSVSEGEVRGDSIESGSQQNLGKGDVVHIPPNVPHQLLLQPGDTFSYFVVKVRQ